MRSFIRIALLFGSTTLSTHTAFGIGIGKDCYLEILANTGSILIPNIETTPFTYDTLTVIAGSPTSHFVIMRGTRNGKKYIIKLAQGSKKSGEITLREKMISKEYANYRRLQDSPEANKYISGTAELKRSASGLYLEIEDLGSKNLDEYFKVKSKTWKNPREAMRDFLTLAMSSIKPINFIHKNNALHFDISPKNLIVSPEGVKLIDLEAISFQETDGTYTPPHSFPYNSPPELLGKSIVNKAGVATDIYSWADSMNYIYSTYVAPQMPGMLQNNSEQILLKKLGKQFKTAIFKLNQANNPLERHQSMKEVYEILRAMLSELN